LKVLLFPGSFDPFTLGHQNIAKRASRICDKLIVAVLENDSKNPLFSLSERKELIKKSLAKYKNIEVISYQGLLVDLYKDTGATATVRGLRSESDFRYETEMALANRLLYPDYDVIFLSCREDLSLTSSTIVKEVGHYGWDISKMVPKEIYEEVSEALRKGRKKHG